MKQRLQCNAIRLDDHLIGNFGQGGNGVWDSDCLCKHTVVMRMGSTHCSGSIHIVVM